MDKMTKLLMAAIAAGLIWNAAMLTINSAHAEDDNRDVLKQILWAIDKIENGTCVNRVLCGK
jgi:hypothetical protein